MKKQTVFLVLLVFAAGVIIYWLFTQRSQRPEQLSNQAVPTNQSQPNKNATVAKPTSNQSDTRQSMTSSDASIPEAVMEYVRRSTEDPQYDWKQPINFYGRVVDENGNPVASANAHFKWTDLSVNGTSEADATSDENGVFSLVNRTGKRMSVSVGKDGYYSPRSEFMSFEYANPADGLFTPNPNKPVIFHLRKKGVGAELITSEYGVKPYFGVTVPLDGISVQADLLERKTGQGALTITQIKPEYKNWKQATNWSFRMEIPDGGFIGQNDEFPFTAPEEGYQPVVVFNFLKDQPDWVENLKTNYYIKFGNPPRYGWLKLDTSILMSGARLTYAINPDGSRNLEPK